MANEEIVNPSPMEDDRSYDEQIRPQRLPDFPGQDPIKEKLAYCHRRGEAAWGGRWIMCCLAGLPGLGKTTLARILANEMGVDIKQTSGPVIERQADLSAYSHQPGGIRPAFYR